VLNRLVYYAARFLHLRDPFDQVALGLLQASVAVKGASRGSTFSVQIQVRRLPVRAALDWS